MKDERIFLSVDFEDLAHDLKRDLGLWETGPLRIEALWKCYGEIDALLQRHAARATFFCTGIIADQAPDLVARIARDGHEVACHYHFHDELRRETAQAVEVNIQRAKAALEAAAGTPVIGFRAPKFRIDKTAPDQYRAVERHFAYDSSFFTGRPEAVEAFRRRMGLSRLKLLPIFSARRYGVNTRLRLGGSFVKLSPLSVTAGMVELCQQTQMIPHLYIHPYEFARSGEFEVSDAELAALGRRRATYWSLRQMQWNRIGNKALPGKLDAVCDAFGLRGILRDNLDLFGPATASQ